MPFGASLLWRPGPSLLQRFCVGLHMIIVLIIVAIGLVGSAIFGWRRRRLG